MKKAISFDIKNNQEEYANCLQFMQHYNLVKSEELSNSIHFEYMEYEIEGDSYKTACELEKNIHCNNMPISWKKLKIYYGILGFIWGKKMILLI